MDTTDKAKRTTEDLIETAKGMEPTERTQFLICVASHLIGALFAQNGKVFTNSFLVQTIARVNNLQKTNQTTH